MRIFDSTQGQHNLITILQKGKYNKKSFNINVKSKNELINQILNNQTTKLANIYHVSQDKLYDEWVILD